MQIPCTGMTLGAVAVALACGLGGCKHYESAQQSEASPRVAVSPRVADWSRTPPPSRSASASEQAQAKSRTAAKSATAKSAASKAVQAPAKSATPPPTYRPAGQPPAADAEDEANCVNVEACASVLKAMVDDPYRTWMSRPAPPGVLANGVRLFAYRALRADLACPELAVASMEVDAAVSAFRWGVPGLSPDRADRARALSTDVGRELQAEGLRRCDAQKSSLLGPPAQSERMDLAAGRSADRPAPH